MTCKIEGCDGKLFARGWCGKHYNQWRRNHAKECKAEGCNRPAEKRGYCNVCYNKDLKKKQPVCTFPGCNKPQTAKGLCVACYSRKHRHGSPDRIYDGKASHSLYYLWHAIDMRCNNPNAANYQYYGGSGVKMCERWREFWNFVKDMGERPSPRHSVERIDRNGYYEPSNCCWVLPREQSRNKRSTKLTEALVRQIKARHRRGEKCHVIAKSINVHFQTVNSVLVGKSWRDVEPGIFD